MTELTTDQLSLWRGDFGKAYIDRNEAHASTLFALTGMWARMLRPMSPAPATILEVGCNIGLNLRALNRLTGARLIGVEPNAEARARILAEQIVAEGDAVDGIAQALPFKDGEVDLAFTSGVLIHVDPKDLAACCREIARVSRRYVLCSEYFSTTPRMVPYRGEDGQLFTRDFGAFYLEQVPQLRLVDYGFFWTGAGAPDDLTWWLFEKTA